MSAALPVRLLAALAFALAPARAQEGTPPELPPPAVRRALTDLRNGKDVDKSVETLRAEIDKAKDRGALAFQIGALLVSQSMYSSAQQFLELARELRPDDGVVAFQLGRTYTALKQYAPGLEALTAAEKLLPPGPRPQLNEFLSMVLTGLQRGEEAEARAKLSIEHARQWNAAAAPGKDVNEIEFQLNLANVYQQFLRFDEALKILDALPEATMSRDDRARALLERAEILDAKGDQAAAIAAFTRQRELAPDDAKGAAKFGLFHAKYDRPADARPLLEQAIRLDPTNETAWFTLGRTLLKLRESDAGKKAMARYQQLLDARIANDKRLHELRARLQQQGR